MAALVLSGTLFGACTTAMETVTDPNNPNNPSNPSNPENPGDTPQDNPTVLVTIQASAYDNGGTTLDGEKELTDVRGCLFVDGKMTSVYEASASKATGDYTFTLDKNEGTFYVLSNAGQEPDWQELLAAGTSEKEFMAMTQGLNEGKPIPFFSGSVTLAHQEQLTLPLKRGVARFDLLIRSVGQASVEKLTLEGAMLSTGCFPDSATTMWMEQGSLTFTPTSPYTTDTPGVAYVYEQPTAGMTLKADVVTDGKRYELEAKLPDNIDRNHIYLVTILQGMVEEDVQMTVEPWDQEDNTNLLPDYAGQIVVNGETSELPTGVTVSPDKTEVTLPYGPTELVLALDCNNELELQPVTGYPLTVEPETVTTKGLTGKNIYRIKKQLYAPGMPEDRVVLQFRRKGLNDIYQEDQIILHLSANPTAIEGLMSFDANSYTFDFNRYADNEYGRFTLPTGKEMVVEIADGEDPWVKVIPDETNPQIARVVAGWRPNDPKANGRKQSATLVIRNTADGSAREEYHISRLNYGLPVTWYYGVWWCKYNARGNSRDFNDQILCPNDPAVKAGKTVYDYLRDCTNEEFYDLWGWEYQGNTGKGLKVVDDGGKLVLDGYSNNITNHINKLDPKALAPDGYEIPSMEEFGRMFNAYDWGGGEIWIMRSGSHTLYNPWQGYTQGKREIRYRNNLPVGSVTASNLLYAKFWSPNFTQYEAVTWYGPGSQWDANGINHGHYNNILFAVYSPEGSGWYFNGSMSALYIRKNAGGTKDTRIIRFKKSDVEFTY